MPLLRTVLFDVDGTLLDTREFILAAYEHSLGTLGLPVPGRAALAAEVGRPLDAIYRDYAGDRFEEGMALHRAFQLEHLHLATAYPGTEQVLGLLHAVGIRMAAVTSRSARTSVPSLELAGLARFFEATVSAEDAPALKPDPAPLLLALKMMDMGVEGAVMCGDTRHDVDAGKALGIPTVGVTYGFGGPESVAGADVVIDSIGELVIALASIAGANHYST